MHCRTDGIITPDFPAYASIQSAAAIWLSQAILQSVHHQWSMLPISVPLPWAMAIGATATVCLQALIHGGTADDKWQPYYLGNGVCGAISGALWKKPLHVIPLIVAVRQFEAVCRRQVTRHRVVSNI